MVVECCSQEKTYSKFYGLIGERFAKLNRLWTDLFEASFAKYYDTIHRYETNRLRNIARFFGHLFGTDAIGWHILSVIHLNEEETTSSSRIFIKILFQELAEALGMPKLQERLRDEILRPSFEGIFPTDNPRNTRFSINYFTSIGMGALTEDMREYLKNLPKPTVPALAAARAVSDSESVSSYSSYSSYTGSSRSRSYSRSRSPSRTRGRDRGGRGRSVTRSASVSDRGGKRGRARSYSSSRSRSPSRSVTPPPRNRRARRDSPSVSASPPPRNRRVRSPTRSRSASYDSVSSRGSHRRDDRRPAPPARRRASRSPSRSVSRSRSPPPRARAANGGENSDRRRRRNTSSSASRSPSPPARGRR